MTRKLSPAAQARIPMWNEQRPLKLAADEVFVGAQNIALARIDVQPAGKARRVVLNLYGTDEIDRLIAALKAAKARIQANQRELDEFFVKHPDALAASSDHWQSNIKVLTK